MHQEEFKPTAESSRCPDWGWLGGFNDITLELFFLIREVIFTRISRNPREGVVISLGKSGALAGFSPALTLCQSGVHPKNETSY